MRVPFIGQKQENRYVRQELLEDIGKIGQKRLLHSKVAIVGCGSLGCAVLQVLSRAGVGKIAIIDRDVVEIENLCGQFLYGEADIGRPKAEAARRAIERIDHEVKAESFIADLNPKNADDLLKRKDLIIDCTDNFEARFLINDYCRSHKIRWVHASAVKDVGRVMAFSHGKDDACFRCIYDGKEGGQSCDESGVWGSLISVVGGLQAHMALLILLGKSVDGRLMTVGMESIERISVRQNDECPVCKKKSFEYLSGQAKPLKLCGSSCFQVIGKKKDLRTLKERLERLGKVDDFGACIRFQGITIFEDGRSIIKAGSVEEARAIHQKYVGH